MLTSKPLRIWAILIVVAASLPGAQPGLRYLDDISHLATDYDARTSVRFGRIQVVAVEAGNIRFQGRDDNGKAWHAVLPVSGGIGYTTVWRADFDRNSRPDLLIASEFPKVGRCIDPVTLAFLLSDEAGRPIPWLIQTFTPFPRGETTLPALFSAAGDGKLKLVTTDCQEDNGDRSVTGIYEAEGAMWRLVQPARLDSYTALVRRKYRTRDQVRLLPVTPANWLDQGNYFDEKTQPQTTISAVLPASPECRHVVNLPIGPDGRVFIDVTDPCQELGKDRLDLSDGKRCYGWPTVMLDRPDSREIVAETERKELEPLLREIAAKQYPVRLAGEKELGKCSPSLVWARVRN